MSAAVTLLLVYILAPLAVVIAAAVMPLARPGREVARERVLIGLAGASFVLELVALAYFARLGPFAA